MWNPGPDRARTTWQTRPALRTTEFFEEAASVFREARDEGRPPDGQRMTRIVETYSDEFRLGTSFDPRRAKPAWSFDIPLRVAGVDR